MTFAFFAVRYPGRDLTYEFAFYRDSSALLLINLRYSGFFHRHTRKTIVVDIKVPFISFRLSHILSFILHFGICPMGIRDTKLTVRSDHWELRASIEKLTKDLTMNLFYRGFRFAIRTKSEGRHRWFQTARKSRITKLHWKPSVAKWN